MYLIIDEVDGYIECNSTEEKSGSKYLVFNSVDSELLKKYAELWDGIKHQIKTINSGKENDSEKDFMKLCLILMMICH